MDPAENNMANRITEKWQLTGLLSGLTDEQQETMALGLENQGIWCMKNGFENSAMLMPVARALMIKIMKNLVTVPLPAFSSKEGNALVVSTVGYNQSITSEELNSLSPAVVEKIASSLADKLLAEKKDRTTIYLYTPIILSPTEHLSYQMLYRAAFG